MLNIVSNVVNHASNIYPYFQTFTTASNSVKDFSSQLQSLFVNVNHKLLTNWKTVYLKESLYIYLFLFNISIRMGIVLRLSEDSYAWAIWYMGSFDI